MSLSPQAGSAVERVAEPSLAARSAASESPAPPQQPVVDRFFLEEVGHEVCVVSLPDMDRVSRPCRLQEATVRVNRDTLSFEGAALSAPPAAAAAAPDVPHTARVVLFVSHFWRSKLHPDPDGSDWALVKTYVWRLVCGVVDTCALLNAVGVPRGAVLYASARHLSGAGQSHPDGGFVASRLFARLLRVALETAPEEGDAKGLASPQERVAWVQRVAQRCYVWFDFMSLPQHPRTAEERVVFHRALQSLPRLIPLLSTLAVNTSATGRGASPSGFCRKT